MILGIRFIKAVLKRVLLLCLALSISELSLRALGYHPVGTNRTDNLIGFVEKDPVTGWKLKPGKALTIFPDEEQPVVITISSNGTRISSLPNTEKAENHKAIVLIGGSFLMGTGLFDHETLPYILQGMRPEQSVYNLGVIGYGGCQSLLLLKQFLANSVEDLAHVIYVFPDFHSIRNVGDPLYLWRMARMSRDFSAYMPYCTLSDSQDLVVNPPTVFTMPFGWFVDRSSLGTLLADIYYSFAGKELRNQVTPVTEKIALEMNEVTQDAGGKFSVLFVHFRDDQHFKHYQQFFNSHNIHTIDGRHPEEFIPEQCARDKSHPGTFSTTYWAELLNKELLEN